MIVLVDGMLSIEQEGQEPIIITEQPMAVYEQFYILYSLAISVLVTAQEATFMSLFVDNKTFRGAIVDALKVMGITNPGLLTPRAIQELVISRTGPDGKPIPGYLFSLHQEVPPTPGKQPKTSQKKRSLALTLRGWWQLILLKILPSLTTGLSAAF